MGQRRTKKTVEDVTKIVEITPTEMAFFWVDQIVHLLILPVN
jgi:hypothetical protein